MQQANTDETRSRLALARLLFDIAAPIAVYYVLRAEGASYEVSLLIGAALSAIGSVVTLLAHRRVDPVGALMVASLLGALAGSLISGNPRFLLAKDGLLTGLWGAWFVASARGGRPAALVFARPLMEGTSWFGHRSWDLLWATEPRFRRIWRVATVTWGIGLLFDAAIRTVIAYSLPIDQVPAIGGALYPVTFVVLQIVTNVYYTRAGLYALLGVPWLDGPPRSHKHVVARGRAVAQSTCLPDPKDAPGTLGHAGRR